MVSWCGVGNAEIIKLGNCKMTINTNTTTSKINEINRGMEEKYYEIDLNRGTIKAVEILNNNWNKFSHLHGKVSDMKIVTLISLELQDTLVDIKGLEDKLYHGWSK